MSPDANFARRLEGAGLKWTLRTSGISGPPESIQDH